MGGGSGCRLLCAEHVPDGHKPRCCRVLELVGLGRQGVSGDAGNGRLSVSVLPILTLHGLCERYTPK